MRKAYCLLLFFLLQFTIVPHVNAQSLLTLDDALKMALENNYSILVAKNDADIARVNNYAGNAGMLPRVTGTALDDNQTANTYQKYANGQEKTGDAAATSQFSTAIELGWTIFDGFRMFATRNRLKELQDIGELRMRSQIEFTFIRVIRAYFDVVQGNQLLKVNEETVKLSQDRMKLANDRFMAGKAAKTEVLNAQVDLNTDRSALMRQSNAVKNSKALLNQLLARDINTNFDVSPDIGINADLKISALLANAQSQNSSVLIAKKNAHVSSLLVKEIESERMPTLQLYTGYGFNTQSSQAGFIQYGYGQGYHYGAGVSMNLFNGFSVTKRTQAARIGLRSNELVLKDTVSRVEASIQQSYNTYLMALELLKMETENVTVADKNFDLAKDQYRIGVISSLDLRVAQQNLLISQSRLFTVQYEAKLAETDLLRLSGDLLKMK